MKKLLMTTALLCGVLGVSAVDTNVHVNQLGYAAQSSKQAMICNPQQASQYIICDAVSGQEVYRDSLKKGKNWRMSGEEITWADFSKFNKNGNFVIKVGNSVSPKFSISNNASNVYEEALKWSVKGFYLWRCSTPIEEQYATFNGVSYARKAGHPDNNVIIFNNSGNKLHGGEKTFSSPGGWYDAGDYGKYIVNASITVHTLLTAYVMNPGYFDNLNLNIPESNNSTADILDEVMYELKWMLTMQDQTDGGVYNKVTTLNFPNMVMPSEDKRDRYAIGKSQDCAYDFAAVMALASRIYKGNKDYPDFSEKALVAAQKAYDYAKGIKKYQMFQNPSECSTGTYGSSEVADEKYWANCELLITTGDPKYAAELKTPNYMSVPFWGDVTTLGLISMLINKESVKGVDTNTLVTKFRNLADDLLSLYNSSAGHLPIREFYWGSNGQVANSGLVLALTSKLINDAKPDYMVAAQYCLDYLLGNNTTGYCFLTGFGTKSPLNLHDRRSAGDGIKTPLPGYIVGGPSLDGTEDCGITSYPSKHVAKAYLDKECSYSTNEIAINWNAPFVCLLSLLSNSYK